MPNYHIFLIIRQYLYQDKSLQVIFYYSSYTWTVHLNTGAFHPSSADSGPSGSSSVFLQVFIGEEVYGVPDDASGDTVKVAVHILARLSEHIHKICPFQWWNFSLVNGKTSNLGPTLLTCWIRISKLSDIGLNGFCCKYSQCTLRVESAPWQVWYKYRCPTDQQTKL